MLKEEGMIGEGGCYLAEPPIFEIGFSIK